MTFKTQKQIWEHLIANEGKACLKSNMGRLFGLKDGCVFNFTNNEKRAYSFYSPADWQPYTEPEKCWIQKRVDEVMRPLTASEDSVVKYQMGAEHLAREAIERIEAGDNGNWSCNRAVKILRELIGDSDGK